MPTNAPARRPETGLHTAASPTARLAAALDSALARLAATPVGGYHPAAPNDTSADAANGESASEPTAWATLALARAGRVEAATAGAVWLAEHQARDGSVGVTATQAEPGWPTALAMLAWHALVENGFTADHRDTARYADRTARGAAWAFAQEPWTMPRQPNFGHDTRLEGWSWAPDTHSWLEPTAFFSVALRQTGHADHPRRLEAVRLLIDRLLPSGGANYGNTTVFDQELMQHVHSSGVVAWALAGEAIDAGLLTPTFDYLRSAIARPTGTASLAWAVRGLAAHGQADPSTLEHLLSAWPRVERSHSLHKTALFALAAQEATRP